ncbi:hypothetical protein BDF22DRAFT_658404 [Syncephalis plumigaleata]|nr:hypothetical protein BDF22DRAFT_658404 [Syncephalis plumigaleata]
MTLRSSHRTHHGYIVIIDFGCDGEERAVEHMIEHVITTKYMQEVQHYLSNSLNSKYLTRSGKQVGHCYIAALLCLYTHHMCYVSRYISTSIASFLLFWTRVVACPTYRPINTHKHTSVYVSVDSLAFILGCNCLSLVHWPQRGKRGRHIIIARLSSSA